MGKMDGKPPGNSFRDRFGELGQRLITCTKHGLTTRASDVCPKCLNALWVEYKNLRKLLDQSPEFLRALAGRNKELYEALLSLQSVEKEFGMPTVPSTKYEEAYIKMCDVIAFYISKAGAAMKDPETAKKV